MKNERMYKTTFSSVYPMYVQKAEKKGRTKEEVGNYGDHTKLSSRREFPCRL
ncbi:MAG: DUF2200 family protein [Syntrophomonadaceae bacterium]|nr:DUF2200 family protein [Syntrophomonadaceae bacterium]